MINVSVTKNNNSIVAVEVEGHAGYGVAGEDIVCAGVSTIINTTLLGLLNIVGSNVKYTADEQTANVRFTLSDQMSDEERHDADVILTTMLLGLDSIYQEYSDFINLEVI